jgi:hypothetical protein
MKLEFDHLKRRRVLVAHEIADESAIVADGLGAGSIRDPRGLYDCGVALIHATRHGVYETDGHLIYKWLIILYKHAFSFQIQIIILFQICVIRLEADFT